MLFPSIGVGALLLAVRSDLAAGLLARAIEQAAEAATGEDVTVGRVEVGYLPLEVAVRGLVVTHPPTGDVIATVGAIIVAPGLDGVRPVLRTLTLDAPQVALHVDADGLREFRSLAKGQGGGGSGELPWRELVVRDGLFTVALDGARVEVRDIDATPRPDGRTDIALGAVRVQAGAVEQEAVDVRFPGVLLAGDRVYVPRFDIRFPALTLDGRLAAQAGGPLGGDLAARLDLAALTGADPAAPRAEGVIGLDATIGGTSDAPEVGGAFSSRDLVIWRMDSARRVVATRVGDTEGPWRYDPAGDAPDAVDVGPLAMRWAEGTLGVTARVEPATRALSGVVTAEGVHLARILQSVAVAPTPWVDLTGDVEVHVTGSVAPFRVEGPFEVAVSDFVVRDGPIDARSDTILAIPSGSVIGRVEVDLRHLVLEGRVVSGTSAGRARADIGFAGYGPLRVDVDFPKLDLSVLRPLGDAELGGIATVQGWLGGRYDAPMRAEATLSVQDPVVLGLPIADQMVAELDSDLVRLHLGDIRALLGRTAWQGDFEIAFTDPMTIDTQIYVREGRIHDLAGVFLDIGPADGAVSGTVVLAGEPYHLEGDAALTLAEVDLYGERFEAGAATAWMDDGEFTLESLSLTRRDEAVLVRGSVKRGFKLNMEALTDNVSLAGLDHLAGLGLPLEGALSLDAQVGGTLFEPEPRGRISVTQTWYDRSRLADSVIDFRTEAGVLQWRGAVLGDALAADGTLAMRGEQPYSANATFSGFPLHLFYPRAADGRPVEARLTGRLALAGRFGEDPTPVDIQARFDKFVARWGGHTLSNPEPWVLEVQGTDVHVPLLALEGDDGTSLGFEGYARGGRDLRFQGGGVLNLDLARALVPDLELAEGMAEVSVTIEPDATGAPAVALGARLEDATLRTTYFPADFEALSGTVQATADGYRILDVTADVGGGRFTSGASRIDAEGWRPRRYALEGTLEGARVQYLDYLPPMVGDARLRFDGPVDDLLLSGRIDVAAMDFTDRVDWEAMVLSIRQERLTGSAPEEGARYFSMDLDVVADDTIRLRNNVADAEASARLKVLGDTARPGLVGEVVLKPGGEVFLHEREFELGRGEIRWIDPYTFDPDLDIRLETDVRSHDQDYHVTYGVAGPFSDWRTTTTADPYLSQADVNALLLFGVTREELERYGVLGAALVAETSDLLLGQTPISRANLFVVDRWSLVSGVSERGSSTVTSDLRLVAEKQLGEFDLTVETRLGVNALEDWYASIERRIAEKLYATAYVATEQEGRSLPIGAAYGAEFKWKWEFD